MLGTMGQGGKISTCPGQQGQEREVGNAQVHWAHEKAPLVSENHLESLWLWLTLPLGEACRAYSSQPLNWIALI